jgi:ATP-binding cassette subfamily F protein uup
VKETIGRRTEFRNSSADELMAKSIRFGEVSDLLDEKELRWLELSELV